MLDGGSVRIDVVRPLRPTTPRGVHPDDNDFMLRRPHRIGQRTDAPTQITAHFHKSAVVAEVRNGFLLCRPSLKPPGDVLPPAYRLIEAGHRTRVRTHLWAVPPIGVDKPSGGRGTCVATPNAVPDTDSEMHSLSTTLSNPALDGQHAAVDGGDQGGVVDFGLIGVAPGERA